MFKNIKYHVVVSDHKLYFAERSLRVGDRTGTFTGGALNGVGLHGFENGYFSNG